MDGHEVVGNPSFIFYFKSGSCRNGITRYWEREREREKERGGSETRKKSRNRTAEENKIESTTKYLFLMGGRDEELRLREVNFSTASCHAQSYMDDSVTTRGRRSAWGPTSEHMCARIGVKTDALNPPRAYRPTRKTPHRVSFVIIRHDIIIITIIERSESSFVDHHWSHTPGFRAVLRTLDTAVDLTTITSIV